MCAADRVGCCVGVGGYPVGVSISSSSSPVALVVHADGEWLGRVGDGIGISEDEDGTPANRREKDLTEIKARMSMSRP